MISQLERLNSNETKIAPRSVWIAVKHATRRWREMDSNPRSPVYGELAAPGRAEARHDLVEKPRARGIEAIQDNAAAPEAIPRLRPPASAPS